MEMKNRAVFIRKPVHVQELKAAYAEKYMCGFVVEKVAQISREQFQEFSQGLSKYYRFLYDNWEAMYHDSDKQEKHCILVTTPEYQDGILVEASGYAYPRYCAYIQDCHALELPQEIILKDVDLSDSIPPDYWNSDHAITSEKNSREGR